MSSSEPTHPILRNFLRTWNLIHEETQTEESDFPSTLRIELELETLKKKVEYQTELLQVKNNSTLQSKLDELKQELSQQWTRVEEENQASLNRMRTASHLELIHQRKAIEAKWKSKYEGKMKEILQENEKIHEELIQLKKLFRISQTQSSEEIVQLKTALANAFSWITKNYGESATKEVQESCEEEQTIVLQLHRQLQEKNDQISKLQNQLDDFISTDSTIQDSTSSIHSPCFSTVSLNTISATFAKGEDVSKPETLVSILEEEKEEDILEEETPLVSISSSSPSFVVTKLYSDKSVSQQMTVENPKSPHFIRAESVEAPSTKQKEIKMEEALKKLEKAMELRIEKNKLLYENEISNLKKTIDTYKTQLESLKDCLHNFQDPSKLAIIMGRQKALLDIASEMVKTTPLTPLTGQEQKVSHEVELFPKDNPINRTSSTVSEENPSIYSKRIKKPFSKDTSDVASRNITSRKSNTSSKKTR